MGCGTGGNDTCGYRALVNSESIVVDTPFGRVRGRLADANDATGATGAATFLGIRYATAERFEAPVAVRSWAGELDATRAGASCPQLPGMLERALGDSTVPANEDCLSLNVFTPGCDDEARPVLVWIHGGGFTTGSGSMPWYHGGELASRGDVVVVTINYRLGVFGFSGRANCGLRDQIVALEWVQACVASFGGDPAAVTIVGESAGGSSVVALMATPSAATLFRGAVAMSPSLGQLRTGDRADEALDQYLAAAEVRTLDDLRAAPVDLLLAVQADILRPASAGFTGFSPCNDGELVPMPILEAAAQHAAPLMIGTTRDEMRLFHAFDPAVNTLDEAGLEAHVERRFPGRSAEVIATYRSARSTTGAAHVYSAMLTDEVFRNPMIALADLRSQTGSPTYAYWFTWASPAFDGTLGSCHAVDIPFLFHTLDRAGVELFIGSDPDRSKVAKAYSHAVIALTRTGDPGWAPHESATRPMMIFDVDSRVEHHADHAVRQLW